MTKVEMGFAQLVTAKGRVGARLFLASVVERLRRYEITTKAERAKVLVLVLEGYA